jgi:acetyltransferase-like isoleucine patch superfamily enzyme
MILSKKIKKLILKFIFLPHNFVNRLNFMFRNIRIGDGVEILGVLKLYGRGEIKIGDNTRIISNAWLNPIGGDYSTTFQVLSNGFLEIGNECGFSNVSITCATHVRICDGVYLGNGVKIYDTNFHPLDAAHRSLQGDTLNKISKKSITINSNAFIGAHSIILKGVTIGNSSVVGAGSVVRDSIPDNQIWSGNPAVYIKDLYFNNSNH